MLWHYLLPPAPWYWRVCFRSDDGWHNTWCIILCVLSVHTWHAFRAHLAVGLHDSMIPGVSVICGMVIVGALLITLCSAYLLIRPMESTILCFSGVAGGMSIVVMRPRSICNKHFPLVVWFTTGAPSASSLVKACKCWCGDMSGSWQCCGKSSVDPDIWYACVSGI